jgi:hypothetical protein
LVNLGIKVVVIWMFTADVIDAGTTRLPMSGPIDSDSDTSLYALRPSGGEDLPHMLDNVVRLECRAAEFVELAPVGQKVVVGIDD